MHDLGSAESGALAAAAAAASRHGSPVYSNVSVDETMAASRRAPMVACSTMVVHKGRLESSTHGTHALEPIFYDKHTIFIAVH